MIRLIIKSSVVIPMTQKITTRDLEGMAKRLSRTIGYAVKIGGEYGYTTVKIYNGTFPDSKNDYYKQINAYNGTKKEVYYAMLATCETIDVMRYNQESILKNI